MDTVKDDTFLRLMSVCFRNRLRSLIQIQPVLDHVNFLEREQKDLILNKAKTESNQQAVDLLIDTIIRIPRPAGWYRELVDALLAAGCEHAAMYVDTENLPSPSEEAVNDYCVKLIDILAPSLQTMKTTDVCLTSYEMNILTDEEKEIVLTECRNSGNIQGARVLLRRIVQKPPGWFSDFLEALRKSEHFEMIRELTGVDSPQDSGEPATEENDEQKMMEQVPNAPQDNISPEEGEGASGGFTSHGDKTFDESMDVDLYNTGMESHTETLMEVDLKEENMQTEHSRIGADAGGSWEAKIILRPYQMEVARPALGGRNIIICLPTGTGKTRVAVYITKEHLDGLRREHKQGKVVVLVNKIPLVEQHYNKEFGRFLEGQYRVERVSGDSQQKISFSDIVRKNDVIICTAQILENSLLQAQQGDNEGVNLSEFSLFVIDECHHTQKGGVYNNIMIRYLKQKHKNLTLVKEQKPTIPIPQILGLTASPGVGEAKNQKKADEHILKICANLDAFRIMTASLSEHKKEPFKKIATAEERKEDPFGDVIKGIMNAIHEHAALDPPCAPGTQNYEHWVVQNEQNAAKENNKKVRVCVEHLRQYNEALHLSNIIRMSDAFDFLEKYYDGEARKKTASEEDQAFEITHTDRFLFGLFKDNKAKLQDLAKHPEYENKGLGELRTLILKEFTSTDDARGIIFTKTRRNAIALSQWIQENSKFEETGVRASYLIGGGDQSAVKPMTAKEQREVLRKFRTGEINLLIATTVAEEGLDIKECNFVFRYGLVTNEIAMIQARGRARAEDSTYMLVEVKGSGGAERENLNEFRERMMNKAIENVQKLDQAQYDKKKMEFQMQTIMESRVQKKRKQQKALKKETPDKVNFSCRNCQKHACPGVDVEIIENMHHVNVTAEFRELITIRKNTTLEQRLLDYEINGEIACKHCGYKWGSMMHYRGLDCPCLHIKCFVVDFGKNVYNNWSELPVQFPAFDYIERANEMAHDSDSD